MTRTSRRDLILSVPIAVAPLLLAWGSPTKRRVPIHVIYLARGPPQALSKQAAERHHLKKCRCRVVRCFRGYTSCRFRNA